jgi:hypothetical protein
MGQTRALSVEDRVYNIVLMVGCIEEMLVVDNGEVMK